MLLPLLAVHITVLVPLRADLCSLHLAIDRRLFTGQSSNMWFSVTAHSLYPAKTKRGLSRRGANKKKKKENEKEGFLLVSLMHIEMGWFEEVAFLKAELLLRCF